MFLLILDSLGSTELFFILVMALVFFGPRKLPKLSRSMGKHIAEFRKASEDFKRTWEREVAFEESRLDSNGTPSQQPEDNSILNSENQHRQFSEAAFEAMPAAESVGREAMSTTESPALSAETDEISEEGIKPAPRRKQDWL